MDSKTPQEIAVEEGLRLYALDIRMSDAEEEEMFRLGIGWLPAPEERESCGTFVARCFRVAGMRPDVLKYAMASTRRLAAWAAGKKISGKWTPPPTMDRRRISIDEVRAGDIICVRTRKVNPLDVGDHICLVLEVTAAGFVTLEYNATTTGPDGTRRKGLGKNLRPRSSVMRAYRVTRADLA